MNEIGKSKAEKTKYKKIYEGTYWGSGCGAHDQMIVDNRNNFVSLVGLKSRKKNTAKIDNLLKLSFDTNGSIRDHFELYNLKEKGKVLGLFSTYDTSEKMTNKIIEEGYKEVLKLYSQSARTFIKIVDTSTRPIL